MNAIHPIAYTLCGIVVFAIGATVGSFANVCIYRIPLEKSVVWPSSHCPRCFRAIAGRDNIPILGWLILRGKSRCCGLPIAARYPAIELLGAALFLTIYLIELWTCRRHHFEPGDFVHVAAPMLLSAFLLVATFIDYDHYILPDSVTVTGMIVGLGLGTIVPHSRPDPDSVATALEGLKIGVIGLLVGGGVIWAVRIFGALVFRKEAMGFGDVTLMAMIGSFLGWRVVLPTLFLAAILGLIHAAYRMVVVLGKWMSGRKLSGADGEIPFGPYLSMAALILMLGWPWIWPDYLSVFYTNVGQALRFLLRGEV